MSSTLQRCVLLMALLPIGFVEGQTTFLVSPENQPVATEPAAKLKLYSDLNLKLAASVEEPASSCLKSYAEYQACKAGDKPKKCKKAPECVVTTLLPTMDLSGISFHFVPGVEAATLVPIAPVVPKEIKVVRDDSVPPPPSMGVAGMGGMPGGSPGGVMGGMAGSTAPIVVKAAQQRPPAPVLISGGVVAGLMQKRVLPVYPPVAKVMHIGGTVVLRALITKQGTIDSLSVSSATSPVFDNAAVDAVRQWQYKPYLLNGEPTMVDTTITVNFTLNK